MCRTHHFHWKGQCATEIQVLNTPHERQCCHGHQAMMPLWRSSINTLCFPQKTGTWTFHDRGWGRQRYLPPRLRGDMATPMVIALDSSFIFPLIRRILVDMNGNGQHHVKFRINKTSNISCSLVGNNLVVCSDVVGASPVGAAPTISSLLT